MRVLNGQHPTVRSGLAVLLFLLLTPPAAAQLPPAPELPSSGGDDSAYLVLNLGVVNDEAYVFVRPGQQARIAIEVQDLSADRAQDARNPFPHSVTIEASIIQPVPRPQGYTVTISNNSLSTAPGTTSYATLIVSALFAAEQNYVTIAINGTLTGGDGDRTTDSTEVKVQLLPFYAGRVRVLAKPETVGQEELITYPLEIENQATYPDWFTISLNATPGFRASAPDRIYVPPLSKRIVNMTVYTPRTGFFEWGTLGIVGIEIRSVSDPGFRYQATALVNVQGFHVPGYWIPVTLFAVVAAGLVLDKGLDKRRETIAREGRPRRPEPTPRQAVLLKELKKRDPEAYKIKMAALAAVWKARRDAYRSALKTQRAEERRLAQSQRREARAEKKRRKRERKAQRKAEALLEADRKRMLKELAAKQAALDKVQRKEAKVQAKADNKRRNELEKLRQGREKQLAKARKSADKEAKAAEKAARKAAKGRPPPPPTPDPAPTDEVREGNT